MSASARMSAAVFALCLTTCQSVWSSDFLPPLLSTDCLNEPAPKCTETSCGKDCSDTSVFGRESFLDSLQINGYLQQSLNTNNRNPANPPNGIGNWPGVGWMYRNDEYMFNRLYLSVGRAPETSDGQWDVGGQVDVLYGTDYVFLQSRGLETRGDSSPKWNSGDGVGLFGGGLMGLALPQAYLQAANDVVSVKLGHFYHPLGFEPFEVTQSLIDNTPTYSLFFGEFLPVTGGMVDVKLTDQTTLIGGLHRGSGNWEDNNDKLNGFGGFTWTNAAQDTLFMYIFDIGVEDNAGNNDQYIHGIVYEHYFESGLAYLFHSDYGVVQNAAPGGGSAEFYSFINGVAYPLSEKLNVGLRHEIFNDLDGTRVVFAPGPGKWNGVSTGFTYKMTPEFWIRPTIRWDWFDANSGTPPGPFGNGTRRSQAVAAVSVFMFL